MNSEWVEMLITYDPLEAEMIKDLLESGGIPVVLRSSKVSHIPSISVKSERLKSSSKKKTKRPLKR